LINSRPVCFSAPRREGGDPFSLSYGVRLPSSLTAVLSSALGYSPRVPVSVLVRTSPCPQRFSRVFVPTQRHLTGMCSSENRTLIRSPRRSRNINRVCIDYALRPRLSSRLTLGGFTFPRKPYAFGVQDFHLHYRYSCRHSHLQTLQSTSRSAFDADCNALLPLFRIRSFGVTLIPDHLRRYPARPVSYYALFKWWLLLSQTSWLSQQNNFLTN